MLTHGVGPMRRYAIGAVLLDLDDPTRVIGHLTAAAAAPRRRTSATATSPTSSTPAARCCTATLVIPYGMSDANIGVATIPLDQLLDRLT